MDMGCVASVNRRPDGSLPSTSFCHSSTHSLARAHTQSSTWTHKVTHAHAHAIAHERVYALSGRAACILPPRHGGERECAAGGDAEGGGRFRQRVVHGRERLETISLLDLRFENTTACPYLPASKVRVRKAYVYHSFSDNDGGVRGMLGLLCPLDEMK